MVSGTKNVEKKSNKAKPNKARRRAVATRKLRLTWGAERVFLAWIRTAIALMALGFLIARLSGLLRWLGATEQQSPLAPLEATIFGMVLMGLGGAISLIATWRYREAHRNIRRGKLFYHNAQLALWAGMATALIGLGLIISFVVVMLR